MWKIGQDKSLDTSGPRLMAILNATPDSFYAGSRVEDVGASVERAQKFVSEGAAILDIGAESTRPGAAPVSAVEQIERAVPMIRAIRAADGALGSIPISIDTTRSEVALAALDAGADAINDVSAGLDDPAMFALAEERNAGIVLMHRLRMPSTDSYSDQYKKAPMAGDVVMEVRNFLLLRTRAAMDAGVRADAIVVDPGLGFGKSVEQNLELIRRTGEIAQMGFVVLSGLSRKSFVGRAEAGNGGSDGQNEPGDRLAGTLALSLAQVLAGARICRVHDVSAHARSFRAAEAGGMDLKWVD